MMINRKLFHKMLSVMLSVVLIVSLVPLSAMGAPTATPVSNYSATADGETLDGWKAFFGTQTDKDYVLSTEYAGGVWSDKSVFTVPDDLSDLPAAFTAATYNQTGLQIENTEDNFLIALSALASNKEIKGYSTIPTDTVLVLDMSSSMRSKDAAGASAVDELAAAANEAINKLLELNYNNRVGVILYAGNVNKSFSSAAPNVQVLLPLDSYTTTDSNKRFLAAIDNNYSMQVVSGVRNSEGRRVSGEMETATGTFTQSGIYEAMKMLCAADTTIDSGVQAGTDRIPIMVLMTDGEPTLANHSYYGRFNGNMDTTNFATLAIGNSTLSDFDGTTGSVIQPGLTGSHSYTHRDTIAFMSSLTAAFSKKMIGQHYGTKPLMYTLAYGDVVDKRPEALAFLNPKESSEIQDNLWKSFFTGDAVTVFRGGQTTRNVASATDIRHLEQGDRQYVDGYFHADNSQSGSMSEAFQAIVDEIILQSQYYPTLVESDHNHGGYLTFTDKIGKYMQVRDVEGIVVGERLFSGAALAKGFTPEGSIFGTVDNPKDLGDNLIWSLKERLNVDDAAIVRTLVDTAYNYGQLYYRSDSDFSHYIGWFSDANGNYIDFYHKDMTEADIAAAQAKGATHTVRSYLFLGNTEDLKGVSSSDMMYMTVNVTEDLETKDDMVVWKIPASLIPTLTYQIEVMLDESGNPQEVKSLTLNEDSAHTPIRLLYEVGMREGIYDWNVTEKIPSSYKNESSNAAYGEKAAGYYFYSNKWNSEMNATTYNAYSHFEPSAANERYYYINDTAVLRKDGDVYTPYSGETHPKDTGETYYRQHTVYEKLNNGSLRVVPKYEEISQNALNDNEAIRRDAEDTVWYVLKNTMQRLYTLNHTAKGADNVTDTMDAVNNPNVLYIPSADEYYTVTTLGNNGRLRITPSTGIKLTKTLLAQAAGDTDFVFTVSAGAGGDLTNAQVVRLDTSGNEASRAPLPASGQVILAGNETVYIVDVAAGDYQIKEERNDNYIVASINNNTAAGDAITVAVADQTVEAVEFKNQPRSFGTLTVAKDVEYPVGYNPNANVLNAAFSINVTFTGTEADLDMISLPDGLTAKTGTSRTYTVSLKNAASASFASIPQGVSYAVEEPGATIPSGYRYVETVYNNGAAIDHVITAQNVTHLVQIVNAYEPAEVTLTGISAQGSKSVLGGSWPSGGEFTIALYRVRDVQTGELESDPIATDIVSAADAQYSFDLSNYAMDTIGTHYFQILEVEPTTGKIANMSYDKSIGRFSVAVDDVNGDGQLEVTAVRAYGETTINASNTVVTKNFTNMLTSDVVRLPIDKYIGGATAQQIADLNLRGGIMFGAFESESASAPVYTAVTNANGRATIEIPVTKDSLGASGKTYYLRELEPAMDNRVVGMEYDTNFKYMVHITWNDTANKAEVAYEHVGGAPIDSLAFSNQYHADVATSFSLSGQKTINGGNELGGRVFNFSLYKTGFDYVVSGTPIATVSNVGNAIAFNNIRLTDVGMHYFVVRESFGTAYGGVGLDSDYAVLVEVEKYDNNGVTSLRVVEGSLRVYKSGSSTPLGANQLNFNNTYTVGGTVDAVVDGIKVLTGRDMVASEFRFKLTEVSEDGDKIVDGVEMEAHNTAATGTPSTATFAFDKLTYTPAQIGDHYYQVVELESGKADGVTYSKAVFTVKITVADKGDGTLKTTTVITSGERIADRIEFRNEYNPRAVSVPIVGVKEVLGTDGDEIVHVPSEKFSFSITETNADFQTQAAVGIGNRVIKNTGVTGRTLDFGTINFSRVGSRYFVIKEILPTDGLGNPILKKGGYTYDTKEYFMTVSATDNHKGNLEAAINLVWYEENPDDPNNPIVNENDYPLFTNLYEANASAPLVLGGKKVLSGRPLQDKEFTFSLVETDETFTRVLWDEPFKVRNAADGKFEFEGISYTEVGTYYYVMTEDVDLEAKNITFDKTKYYVHCLSGGRSGRAVDYLKQIGYNNVKNIGGIGNFSGKVVR